MTVNMSFGNCVFLKFVLVVPFEDEHGRAFCTVNFHNNCIEDSERLIPHERYSAQISGIHTSYHTLLC